MAGATAENAQVRVRMIQNIAGVTKYSSTGMHAGSEYEVDRDHATAWIKDGLAVPVRQTGGGEQATSR